MVSARDTEVKKLESRKENGARKKRKCTLVVCKKFSVKGEAQLMYNSDGKQIGICGWFCPVS